MTDVRQFEPGQRLDAHMNEKQGKILYEMLDYLLHLNNAMKHLRDEFKKQWDECSPTLKEPSQEALEEDEALSQQSYAGCPAEIG